jgi:hypothetical protein
MTRIEVGAEAVIDAPAAEVYAVLADYRVGHPAILPRPAFARLDVVHGGYGAGTIFELEMNALGKTQTSRQEVLEPEPGRVLMERGLDIDLETTFTVTPTGDGRRSLVVIRTSLAGRDGIAGRIEGFVTRQFLKPLYRKELAQLNAYVSAGQAIASGA